MKNILCIAIALSFLSLAGCSKDNSQENGGQNASSENSTNAATPSKGKYQIKSGIVELKVENNMMDADSKQTLYFDDFGKKERTETYTELQMMGQSIKSIGIVLNDGEYSYSFDPEKKTGTKTKVFGSHTGAQYDFENFSEEMKKDWNLKKEGTINILGKNCDKYYMDNKGMKMKGTVCLWNGIALESDIDMGGLKMKITALSVKENAEIPSDKLTVPADIKFEEL